MKTLLSSARRAAVCLVACASLGACTMVGAVPAERPTPRSVAPVPEPEAAPAPRATGPSEGPDVSTEAMLITARVVDVALESIGTPYQWGGTDGNGFDCSGLIQFAYAEQGIQLPRTSADQIRSGVAVGTRPDGLRPGDILGFSDGGGPKTEHVGLYLGGDEFIRSSPPGGRISRLRNPSWQERLVAARRVVD